MKSHCFCIQCGQKLPASVNFCPYCGTATVKDEEPVAAPAVAANEKDLFYVFAVQGPAFGAPSGDMVLEKAQKLQNEYEHGKDMELKLIRPHMWDAQVQSSSGFGVISVSYSMDGFNEKIRSYLKKEGLSEAQIEKGLSISNEESLQLSNPMSGVFVMGIPIAFEARAEAVAEARAAASEAQAKAPEAKPDPATCSHEYEQHVCKKCGTKEPKPVLKALGIKNSGQYTYEYYEASDPETAKYFLSLTEVTKPLYYVMVETPQGKWGRDKDGMFLEQLCDFQHNTALAQCDAVMKYMPSSMLDVQMAANKMTDNYLLEIACGSCGHEWKDGVAYRSKTVVKCPKCGKYNLANTEHIRFNNL